MPHLLHKISNGYLIPVASVFALYMTLGPVTASANTSKAIKNEGAIGGYTGSCVDTNCDTSSSCRVLNPRIYDDWHKGHRCSGSLITSPGTTETCHENNRLCRDIQTWTGVNCTGVVIFDEVTNLTMCDGGGAPIT